MKDLELSVKHPKDASDTRVYDLVRELDLMKTRDETDEFIRERSHAKHTAGNCWGLQSRRVLLAVCSRCMCWMRWHFDVDDD